MIVASGAGVHALWGGKEGGLEGVGEAESEVEGEGEVEGEKKKDGEKDYSLPFAYVRGQNIHFTQTNSQSNPQSNSQSNPESNLQSNSQSNLPSARTHPSPFPSPLLSGEYLIPRSLTLRSPTSESGGNTLTLVGGGTHEHLASWNDLTGTSKQMLLLTQLTSLVGDLQNLPPSLISSRPTTYYFQYIICLQLL